jgi:hypothetical protein
MVAGRRRIAFTGRPDTGGGVHLIQVNGSAMVRLAADPEASGLAWSGCAP